MTRTDGAGEQTGDQDHPVKADANSPARNVLKLLAAALAVLILYQALLPFELHFDRRFLQQAWRDLLDYPFGNRAGAPLRVPLSDFAANVLMFVIFGAVLQRAIGSPKRHRLTTIGTVMLTSVLLSMAVETLELFSANRVSSLLDLYANSTGGLIGAVLAATLAERVAGPLKRRIGETLRAEPLAAAKWLMIAMLLIAAAAPFDLVSSFGAVKYNLNHKTQLIPFYPLGNTAVEQVRALTGREGPKLRPAADTKYVAGRLRSAIFFAILGGIIGLGTRRRTATLRTATLRTATLRAAVLTATIVAAVGEVIQLFSRSHVADVTELFVAAGGAMIGAMIASGNRDNSRRLLRIALAAVAVVIVLQAAEPFRLEQLPHALEKLNWRNLTPLAFYQHRTDLSAVQDAAQTILNFTLLGFLALMLRRPSRRATAGIVAAGTAIAAGLELMQIFIVGRTPAVTDVLLAAVGAYVGCAAALAYMKLRTRYSQTGLQPCRNCHR